jgi:hypothetical protein
LANSPDLSSTGSSIARVVAAKVADSWPSRAVAAIVASASWTSRTARYRSLAAVPRFRTVSKKRPKRRMLACFTAPARKSSPCGSGTASIASSATSARRSLAIA